MTDRVVFAHGFTQTAKTWADIEAALPTDIQTVAVDLPGHGSAGDIVSDLWGAADHLVDSGGPATYVGYSMGGRVALHAALAHPDMVQRLVLIGATAGIDDNDERAERRSADERLADHVETIGVAQFIDEWLRNPLFAGLTPATAQRGDRLRNTEAGLASSLRTCGTGTQQPLWERLDEITCPTLLLVGERDAKFRVLANRLAEGIRDARTEVVATSGHCTHLEAPAATAAAIAAFVGSTHDR